MLLQAELHNLNQNYAIAELVCESSIASAWKHRFIHEEAMTQELFGICFVGNDKVEKGIEQLQLAYDNYKTWGVLKKAKTLKIFLEPFLASFGDD